MPWTLDRTLALDCENYYGDVQQHLNNAHTASIKVQALAPIFLPLAPARALIEGLIRAQLSLFVQSLTREDVYKIVTMCRPSYVKRTNSLV